MEHQTAIIRFSSLLPAGYPHYEYFAALGGALGLIDPTCQKLINSSVKTKEIENLSHQFLLKGIWI